MRLGWHLAMYVVSRRNPSNAPIVLATGFTENRPGNGFISQVIEEFELKTATCGFPVIGPSLQWHERIFVTGPLS